MAKSSSNHVSTAVMVMVVVVLLGTTIQARTLVANYYEGKCANGLVAVEDVITFAVQSAFYTNSASRAGVLRMHFHDCFVNGCDGSILIDSPSEKDAIPNLTLHGFEVIDTAKSTIESFCPGVVSCADILALAAQIAVNELSGGKVTWKVLTGRLDGTVSTAANTNGKLPPPTASVDLLKQIFYDVGLSTEQMVTLSGAHTVGVAHCASIQDRISPPASTLDSTYADFLEASCPAGSTNTVNLDNTTATTFDEAYYTNLQQNKGLLTSDENLQYDATTQPIVYENSNLATFGPRFASAMIAMGNIPGATVGNIRSNCRKFNA